MVRFLLRERERERGEGRAGGRGKVKEEAMQRGGGDDEVEI